MHPLAHILYCVHIYLYIYIRVHVCNKILGEKEIERQRDRERERERETLQSLLKSWRCFRCYFGTGISLNLESFIDR